MNKVLLFFALIPWTLCAQDFSVYISDAGNFNSGPWQILKVDSNGDNEETFIDENLDWPQDILFMEDSSFVLISNLGSNSIDRFDSETGEYLSTFTTEVSGPTRMKIGSDGLLYVLQWSGDGLVKRFELDGSFYDDFTSVGVSQSIGMDWDEEGNLYVSSYNGDDVRKFDSEGNDLGDFVTTNLIGPTNIWFDEEGDLLVSDYNSTAVRRYDSEGSYVSDFITGLGNSEGVSYMDNGDILIGNGSTQSVKRFDADGNYIEEFVESGAGGLLTPNAVVIRYDNDILGGLEILREKQDIVRPSIGEQFSIVSIESYKSIEIYSMNGSLIKTLSSEDMGSWTGQELSPGTYILITNNIKGQGIEQRIVKL